MPTALYLGNFETAPWTTETHVARSLETLGWQVQRLQENRTSLAEVEARGGNADLLLFQRTWGSLDPGALVRVWRAIEANGTVTATLSLDLYLGLEREAMVRADQPAWATQWVFTADGDPASQAEFARRGVNHHWLAPAVVADECYEGTYRERFAHDVIFVGTEQYHHEHDHRAALLRWLAANYPGQFYRYGNGTEVVRGALLNDLYASAACAIGDSLNLPDADGNPRSRYTSDRLPETLGRGGVLVYPRIPGVFEHYGLVEGEHLLAYNFGRWPELHDQINWCLTRHDDARAMARRGQAHIAAHHTYTDRMKAALAIMGLSWPDAPSADVRTAATGAASAPSTTSGGNDTASRLI